MIRSSRQRRIGGDEYVYHSIFIKVGDEEPFVAGSGNRTEIDRLKQRLEKFVRLPEQSNSERVTSDLDENIGSRTGADRPPCDL